MARPLKSGLEYFSLDVDFFNDQKIMEIAASFGEKGELIAIKLLCRIYRDGYFINWNNGTSLTFAKFVMCDLSSREFVNEVVLGLVNCGFFDRELFESFNILTSRGIQRRWQEVTKRCKRKEKILDKFNLLNDEDQWVPPKKIKETPVKQKESRVKQNVMLVKQDESRVMQNDTGVKQDDTCVMRDDNLVKQNDTFVMQNDNLVKQEESCVMRDDTLVKQEEVPVNEKPQNANEIKTLPLTPLPPLSPLYGERKRVRGTRAFIDFDRLKEILAEEVVPVFQRFVTWWQDLAFINGTREPLNEISSEFLAVKLRSMGTVNDQKRILQQTILKGWKDLYPLDRLPQKQERSEPSKNLEVSQPMYLKNGRFNPAYVPSRDSYI